MLKLKQRFDLRIPDRFAVAAALVLTVTALGGVLTERKAGDDPKAAPVQMLKAQAVDTQSDDAVERHSAKARLLLFRRG
jgi:hypothetical protein